ncbi:MAG TPA: DUF4382 domain-containing protein [Steroidobacteraceae bacterium]|jgi:hypothetical protein|nr:DUF4382 domain-containing protein [Steroidobacteraceae bacterium]
MRSRSLVRLSLLLAACLLAACGARTDVSATANVRAEYSHVWVTIQDVKFNTSATALAGDSSWLDFPLSTPVTIDLATVTNGALAVFGSALKIPTGTYAQMQLLLTDSAAPLASSAQAVSLLFNDQVQYLDTTGAAVTAPLDLVHPEQGIVLSVALTIPNDTKAALDAIGAGTAAATSSATASTTGVGTTGVSTTGVTTPTTSTCATTTTAATDTTTTVTPVTTTTDNCSGVTTATFSVGIDFDAERDLVPFTYSSQPGFLLNPHLTAYDLSTAGTIQGQLTLPTTTATTTTASGNPDIEVSAETLSSDGTRHVVVKSTPLLSDGSFVLYPLTTNATSTSATTTTTYDLVIHGPNIQTMIIQAVPPSVAAPAAATSLSLSTVTLTSAADFLVNVSTATNFASSGAVVQFYQTVPVSGEVPYVVAQQPIDPFNKNFAGDAALSTGPINVVIYSGGAAATPVSEPPSEGSGAYQVAAIAPNFNDGALGTKVTVPNPSPTTAVLVSVAALSVASGATSDSVTVTTAVAAPGKYNNGELILSQNGAIVAVAALGAVLDQSSGSVTFSRVPGGTASQTLATGLYDLSAWVWNSSNPSGTLSRQSSPKSVDLRSGTATGTTITID